MDRADELTDEGVGNPSPVPSPGKEERRFCLGMVLACGGGAHWSETMLCRLLSVLLKIRYTADMRLLPLLFLIGCNIDPSKVLSQLDSPLVIWAIPQMNDVYAQNAEILATVSLQDADTAWSDLQGEWILDGVQQSIAGIDPNTGLSTWNYGVHSIGDYELSFHAVDLDGNEAEESVTVHVQEADRDGDGVGDSSDCLPDDPNAWLYGVWYADLDADGYGDNSASFFAGCGPVVGFVDNNLDCDDTDPGKREKGVWYQDKDGDGLGNPDALVECGPGVQLVENGDDCDDTDANRIMTGLWYRDADTDGYGDPLVTDDCGPALGYVTNADDCDDLEVRSYPGNTEVCDGIDNDCNGVPDDAARDAGVWYSDVDQDGHGDPSVFAVVCSAPIGSASVGDDCDDHDPTIYPGAIEACPKDNEIAVDSNCDGSPGTPVWWTDNDGDGYGDPTSLVGLIGCQDPKVLGASVAANDDDCDDRFATINPGEDELCDAANTDENCDGVADDSSAINPSDWYPDGDGDGYGQEGVSQSACDAPGTWIASGGDCDDTRSSVHPAASESCNLIDDDCDGTVDDNATDALSWYEDLDGDGYGNSAIMATECTQPAGFVLEPTDPKDEDCNDRDAKISPGAPEVCDSANTDENCDGQPEDSSAINQQTWYYDKDGDGYGANGAATYIACDAVAGYGAGTGDCDDGNANAYPQTGYTDTCDAVDNDCDGNADEDATLDAYEPNDAETSAAVLTPIATGLAYPNVTGTVTATGMNFTSVDLVDWYKVSWVDSSSSNLKLKVEFNASTSNTAEVWIDNGGVRSLKSTVVGTGSSVSTSVISGSASANEFAIIKVSHGVYITGECSQTYSLTIKTYNQ